MDNKNFDVSELFLVGFNGTSVTEELKNYLDRFSFGGIILFSRNIRSFEQWNELAVSLQDIQKSKGKLPYLLAVDEEGGTVSRMPDDSATMPGARAIMETGDTHLAYTCATIIGDVLLTMGCNLNLAPVLDVNVNPLNPGIGIRSFANNSHQVTVFGTAFLRGMKDTGILACAKHFPGKGDILRDSHKTLPVCSCLRSQIEEVHLPPFISAIRENIPCVMTSHAKYPSVDPYNPGTLSPVILNDILRNELGFSGLILSDDMEMGAMRECGSIGENAYRAIMAGCDLLLICHTAELIEQAHTYLSDKLQTDNLFFNKCMEAYGRISELKTTLSWPCRIESFDMPVHATASAVAKHSIRIHKDELSLIPIPARFLESPILLCGAHFRSAVEVEIIGRTPYDIIDMHRGLTQSIPNIRLLSWDLSPDQAVAETVANHDFNQYRLIIVCANNAGLFPTQKNIIETILERAPERTIFVAVKNPEDIELFPQASSAVATYGYNKVNIEALINLLFGANHSAETG